ncbi:type II toxin-antitoxin system death-on-curing family toxin [Ferrovibrio sp.]|uniref:type II toxin-antitoxin system death-on-curing family toxin n=1 Tax=Ferrovibrio sp. TaxID=1917215 RepID=UPI002637C8F7|nr:type II toxin-antitoxin system death-on-curing family toxin [Ferrovibrio sp.]
MEWEWIDAALLLAVHDVQIAEHGGGEGLRDAGLLESTLARPVNLSAYGQPDVADLATAYGFGIAKNHPFVDGNKRTAFVAMELFLDLNGYELTASDADALPVMLALAAGELAETALAEWVRGNIRKL